MRGNCKSFKGTYLTVVEGMHHFVSPAVPGIVYHSSRFDVILNLSVVYNTIFRCGIQRAISSWCVIVHGSQYRTFQSIGATM